MQFLLVIVDTEVLNRILYKMDRRTKVRHRLTVTSVLASIELTVISNKKRYKLTVIVNKKRYKKTLIS